MLGSDNRIYVPQPQLATTTKIGALNKLSGNTTDFLDGTNNFQQLAAAVQPTIWSARLRSFNAFGNPNFEVDQRNVGNAVVSPGAGVFIIDRWLKGGSGAYTVNCRQYPNTGAPLFVPGTNFRLSSQWLQVVLTTQETSLAAADFLVMRQLPEGIQFRELANDVHALSLLVMSSVAPLKFGVALRDPGIAHSLTKLCTISTANVWTLIQLPNLPVFPSAGNFGLTPGVQGYDFCITLACGSTNMSPANDTWQNGSVLGAVGQDNFCAQAVGSQFTLGFVQHEPGAVCTTPIDKPFTQNYDECLRYFQKSYDLDVAIGTAATNGLVMLPQTSTVSVAGPLRFHKPMAKVPTMTCYNHVSGAASSLQLGGIAYSVSSAQNVGKAGFFGWNTATLPAPAAGSAGVFHYVADTGW